MKVKQPPMYRPRINHAMALGRVNKPRSISDDDVIERLCRAKRLNAHRRKADRSHGTRLETFNLARREVEIYNHYANRGVLL